MAVSKRACEWIAGVAIQQFRLIRDKAWFAAPKEEEFMTTLLPSVRAIQLAFGSAVILLSVSICGFPAHADDARTTVASASADTSTCYYRGNLQRTGDVGCDVSTPLSVAWQNTLTAVDGNTSSPVIDNGVIFFGDANEVYAINADDGSIKWQYPKAGTTGQSPFYGPPTIADGKVFIGCDDNRLYALDENTGESVWQVVTSGPVRSAPAVDGGIVYFGSMDTKLYAVREDNQQPVWGGTFRTSGPISSAIATDADNVYFADGNDRLFAAVKATGRMLWSIQFQGSLTKVPAVIGNGSVFVAAGSSLYGLAPDIGKIRWRTIMPTEITAAPALSRDNGTLYVPTIDGNLVAVNTRGRILWSVPVGGYVRSAPVIADNSIIVALRSGVVLALSADTGQIEWSYSMTALPTPGTVKKTDTGDFTADPLVYAGAICVLANDGTVTSFNSKGVDELPPTATLKKPSTTDAVAGTQIPYSITVIDAGSGIDPASVNLQVDGSKLPVSYSSITDLIELNKTNQGSVIGTNQVQIPTLAAGRHTLTLKVADWHGNILTQTWNFRVDSKLNPANAKNPYFIPTPGMNDQNQTPSDDNGDSSSTGAGADASPSLTVGGGAVSPDATAPATNQTNPPSNGTVVGPGTVSGGAPGGNTGSGGSGGSGGTGGSGGSGGAPTPVQPPPGAGNFPPPPPI